MKHTFILAILAIASFNWSINAHASRTDIKVHGDTLELINGADTVNVAVASTIVSKLKGMLDDTVINNSETSEVATIVSNAIQHQQEEEAWQQRMLAKQREESREFEIIMNVLTIGASTILAIITLCFIFYYLYRRQKYRIIEKAIENNYELPPSFTGKYPQAPSQPAPQRPVINNPYYGNQPAEEQAPTAHQSQVRYAQRPNPNPNINYVPNQYYMPAFKNGITWTAIGLGFALFFAAVDAEEVACLFLIPIIIGACKLGMEYITQRNRIRYENWKAEQEWMAQENNEPNGNNESNETTPPPFN